MKKNYSFGFDAVDCSLPHCHCIHCTKYLFVLALNSTIQFYEKNQSKPQWWCILCVRDARVWISSSSSSSSMATPTKATSVRTQLLLLCGIVFCCCCCCLRRSAEPLEIEHSLAHILISFEEDTSNNRTWKMPKQNKRARVQWCARAHCININKFLQ